MKYKNERTKKKRIVIIGSGYGGVYTYLGLHKRLHGRSDIEIVLISEHDYFLYLTLVHEVATGMMHPDSIRQELHALPQCCLTQHIQGVALSIDLDARRISIERPSAETEREIEYDYLVNAAGSQTNFLGVPGAKQYSSTLKSLSDAVLIKNEIIGAFEFAETMKSEERQRTALRFVIIGGGPTGVELAGELADYLNHELARAFPKLIDKVELYLIHAEERLMAQMDAWFDVRAQKVLKKKKVKIKTNTSVTKVSEDSIETGDGGVLPTQLVIWVAGVKARELPVKHKLAVAHDKKTDRIKVNNYLQIPNYETAFVVGDAAWLEDKETKQPYPMRAQFAVREGDVAAENITRHLSNMPLKEFAWRDKGFIVSLGKGSALAQVGSIRFSGPLAWWLYRTVYLSVMLGWSAKIRAMLEWTIGLFFPRDISKW